jgi:DUF2075 family protein
MTSFMDVTNIWKNLKEMDLRPLRLEAQKVFALRWLADKEAACTRWQNKCDNPTRQTSMWWS